MIFHGNKGFSHFFKVTSTVTEETVFSLNFDSVVDQVVEYLLDLAPVRIYTDSTPA